MSQPTQRTERNGKVGNSEFPALPELSPGGALTPLDPRLINPIIRAYNALRNIRGGGRTSDGKDTVNVVLAAAGIVVEIKPAPKEATIIGELPEGQGGTGTSSGLTYEGAWSSGGSYAEDAMVIHTSNGQSGLFIRISATAGAGTEPFTGSYTTDWTLLARYHTEALVIRNSADRFANFNAQSASYEFSFSANAAYAKLDLAATSFRFQNSNTVGFSVNSAAATAGAQSAATWASLDAGNGRIRANATATQLSEVSTTGIKSINNASTMLLDYNSTTGTFAVNFAGGGSITLTSSACSNNALTIRELDYCDNGVAKKFLCIAGPLYT